MREIDGSIRKASIEKRIRAYNRNEKLTKKLGYQSLYRSSEYHIVNGKDPSQKDDF